MIPIDRKIQDTITHGFVFVAQSLSKLSLKSPANAKDQTIDRPTYPRYKKGGWNANPGSCNRGFKPIPSSGIGNNFSNGFDLNFKKTIKPKHKIPVS